MELKIKITKKAKGYRAGKLFINDVFFGFTIEDEDRGLHQNMPLSTIMNIKQYGITGIPLGKYEVAMTYSNRFQRYMPQVLNVPGYDGIRIHVANTAKDVEGCIGVAFEDSSDGFAGNSRKAITALEKQIKAIEKKEKIWLVYEDL